MAAVSIASMKHRKLRIAWSVVWGIVALLLIALWVRSYWVNEWLGLYRGHSLQYISNYRGKLFYSWDHELPVARNPQWSWISDAITPATPPPLTDNGHEAATTLGFGWFPARNAVNIFVPHWFALLVVVGAAVASWNDWSSRFSLRLLLIAITLAALVLGLIDWLAK